MNHLPDPGALPLVLTPPGEDLGETFGDYRTCEGDADRIVEARHEHNWVQLRIALGSGVWSRADAQYVADAGITHVIDCTNAPDERPYRGLGVQHFSCPTEDDGKAKPREWFERGIAIARTALADPDARLLVHCAAGINRGPSMCFAILRAVVGLSRDDAHAAIKRVRPFARMAYRDDAERAVSG
jgi:hypothetical protein